MGLWHWLGCSRLDCNFGVKQLHDNNYKPTINLFFPIGLVKRKFQEEFVEELTRRVQQMVVLSFPKNWSGSWSRDGIEGCLMINEIVRGTLLQKLWSKSACVKDTGKNFSCTGDHAAFGRNRSERGSG
jgi:hypothetical protein